MKLIPADRLSLDHLTQVYNESRADYLVPMPMSAARLSEYMRLYDVDLSASWVVADGEALLGLGMLGVRQDRGWITRIGVLPEGRRSGAGTAVTEALLASAAERGLGVVWLEVIVGNEPAYRLFERHGFEPTRELVVARRPPHFGTNAFALPRARLVSPLDKVGALNLLSKRREKPNWLNETDSMANVVGLQGLQVEFDEEHAGWVTFRADSMMLTHVYTGVTCGDVGSVSQALLETLHGRYQKLDAYVENLPTHGPLWHGFVEAGYFDTFRRVEMVRHNN